MKYATALLLVVFLSAVAVGDDTYHAYRDAGFSGKDAVVHPVTGQRPSRIQPMPKPVKRKMSSIKWDVPPGVIIVITDDQMGLGRQLPLWGSGELSSLEATDVDDRAEAWYWAYVDGWNGAPTNIRDAYAPRPIGSAESKQIGAPDSLAMHKDVAVRNKGDKVQMITGVTDHPEGALQTITENLAGSVSSMRWNLPPGVIVVLYENPDGTGRRMVVWGNGDRLDMGYMNDRATVWTWHGISSAP